MAFRRCVMEKSLPFPKDIPMHDIWIGNVAAFFFRLRFIDDVLSDFRRTGNNVSTSAGKSQNSLGMKILIRWIVVKNLVRKIFR
ncbi:MAG: glycosyltransferase family 2 protein, partial [Bacteroidaceae bacterium]|nr:glycosyltransferase family 2 protein [Bacteroidaceae bacterium]